MLVILCLCPSVHIWMCHSCTCHVTQALSLRGHASNCAFVLLCKQVINPSQTNCSYQTISETVRFGLVRTLWLTYRHIFSSTVGLICMWGVCEDGWMSYEPGEADPLSVSGHGAVVALTESSPPSPPRSCCDHHSLYFPTAGSIVKFYSCRDFSQTGCSQRV